MPTDVNEWLSVVFREIEEEFTEFGPLRCDSGTDPSLPSGLQNGHVIENAFAPTDERSRSGLYS